MNDSIRRRLVEFVALEQADSVESFGDKAFQLGRGARVGLPVPPGVVLRHGDARMLVDGSARIRDFTLLRTVSQMPTTWAVRSSAEVLHESSERTHSALLGVEEGRLEEAIFALVRSAAAASVYREKWATTAFVETSVLAISPTAVIIQRMVPGDVSGVLFSRHPVDGSNVRFIEASYGLGDLMGDGLVTPDQYIVEPGGDLKDFFVGEKERGHFLDFEGNVEQRYIEQERANRRCLEQWHLDELDDLTKRTEALLGAPVEIEWTFHGKRLFLLQMRSIPA